MSRLPIAVSVPHGGLRVPPEVGDRCLLTEREIVEDGDEGAAAVYTFADHVERFVTTDVARAILDMNRSEDDRRADGVVKTHTCWNVPVYAEPLPEAVAQELFTRYHRPYHAALTRAAGAVRAGVDCHTMAAAGPPVGPDPGVERPWICLGDGNGATCPGDWFRALGECLEEAFAHPVSYNRPFAGGHIVRTHAAEMPWIQIELSRAPFLTHAEKGSRVLAALTAWCDRLFP